MEYHKLLKRQIKKFFPNAPMEDPEFLNFLSIVNESYYSYDKDIEFSNHAFSIGEREYDIINFKLKKEAEEKKISIEKLKDTIKHFDENFVINEGEDELINISEYIKEQVTKRRKIEIELKKNVKRINSLISNLHTGVLIANEHQEVVFTNQAFCDLFEITEKPNQLIGKHCSDFIENQKHLIKDSNSFIERNNDVFLNRKLVIGDALYLNNGRVLERDFVPLFLNKEYSGHFWNFTDVTLKVNSSDSLAQSEARNRLIMNSALDAIITINEAGYITFWNPQAEKLFGWNEDEVINKPLSDVIIPERYRNGHHAGMNHYNRTGEHNVLQKLIELSALNKDGKEFPVELSITPVKIDDSTIFCSFIRDISERKKIEKTLISREEKYRSIIANMNLGLLEVDNDEVIQYANQSFCDMSGYDLNEILNKKAADLFVRGDNQEMMNQKISLREKGISDAYEIITKNKRGEIKCWLVSGAPRYNNEGDVIGSIGIHLDVTNQKEIEYQLVTARELAEQSAKAKESFLANMSHEIRTPLNGIIGMIRELSKESLSVKQQNYVDDAQKASKHLLSIINNILDFSKIEAGELKLSQNHFCIQNEILDVAHILSNQAKEKNISILINNDENLSNAFIGDALRIRQILLNIIGNSIKFSNNGKIKVDTNVINDNKYHQEFQLKVSDTGIGMEESYVKNIFTKFQQEDISSSRKYGGSGLGLVITKELIDLMNGKIQVQSKKGIGTEITISITLPKGNIEQIQKVELLTSKEFVKNKRILLVEDNEMNRLVAINALEPYNFKIVEAENGQIAIDILKENLFDLILMDLQMPVMGGFEATKIIRDELKITTPIIALTANAFKSEIDKCIEMGMNNYIIKPFEEIELIDAISKEIGSNKNETIGSYNIETNMPKTDLYNLDKLKEMSRGNDDFVKKMLNIFVEIVPTSVNEMEVALANSDFETIKKLAHKLKPSIDNLGVNIKSEIRDLEKFEIQIPTQNVFIELTHFVMIALSNVAKSIKENELK